MKEIFKIMCDIFAPQDSRIERPNIEVQHFEYAALVFRVFFSNGTWKIVLHSDGTWKLRR